MPGATEERRDLFLFVSVPHLDPQACDSNKLLLPWVAILEGLALHIYTIAQLSSTLGSPEWKVLETGG